MTTLREAASKTRFALADIPKPDPGGVKIRYVTGWNTSGTSNNEVIQVVRHPDGREHCYVIMRGLSQAKTAAITMILNAPEEG